MGNHGWLVLVVGVIPTGFLQIHTNTMISYRIGVLTCSNMFQSHNISKTIVLADVRSVDDVAAQRSDGRYGRTGARFA